MVPLGIRLFGGLPASFGNDVVPGGMLKTIQCHHPLPVAASGSYMVTAKLLVPCGAPLQLKLGEILLPVQPKPLNTCSSAILAPSLISALVSFIPAAFAALTATTPAPTVASQTDNFAMAIPPVRY